MALKNIFKPLYLAAQQKFFYNPPRGMLDIYASAGICNRCGACGQSCPSYKALQGEIYSPRGRNQLIKFILDRKIAQNTPRKELLEAAGTCILCGACSAACAAAAPTYKHVTEIKQTPGAARGSAFKNVFLKRRLPKQPARHKVCYLPSAAGIKRVKETLAIIQDALGPAYILKTGLNLTQSALTQSAAAYKKTLQNILAEYKTAGQSGPVVTENIEEYRLLKQAGEYGPEFEALAANAVFIASLIKRPARIPQQWQDKKFILQNNNTFFCGDGAQREIINCPGGNFLLKLCVGAHAAGLMPYAKVKGADGIEKNLAAAIAAQRAQYLITLSFKEKLYLNKLLQKFYPYTKAIHITEFLNAPAKE
ncbi:MAG: (Fe-S)-binding protein [Elusimicrobiota bacterium]|jgi:ferredoxin|nr:(Fe-S)-binding protein [Elusimicrobiota bacterium]